MADQLATLNMGQSLKNTPAGEIPVHWEVTTFGEAFDFLRTANNSRADLCASEGVGYIHYGDLHTKWRTRLNCSDVDLPKIETAKVTGVPLLRDGDLIVADASEDYNGIGVAVEVSKVKGQKIVAGLHTMLLRDRGGRFADGFRGYLQYIPGIRQQLIQVATGISVYGLSKSNLARIAIPRPPLDEQKRIAEILSAADLAITKTTSAIEGIKELKEGLMRLLLSNGIGHKKFKETRIGSIPEDWDEASLGEMTTKVGSGMTPTGGERVYKKTGHPFLRSQNVDWGHLLLDGVAFIDDETHAAFNSTEILAEDVFLNITGASIGRSAVADSRVVGGNVNQHVCIIRTTKDQLHPYFLNYFLLSRAGQKQIDNFQAGGNRQGLNFVQIRNFRVPRPSLSEQKKIVEILRSVDAQLSIEEAEKQKIEEVKKTLLAVLLMGKVRV